LLHWLLAATAILIALLVLLHFTVSHLLNQNWIKEQVLSQVDDLIGIESQYDHADAALFPRPRVTLSKLTILTPHLGNAALESMTVQLRLSALLRGRIQLARLHIESPSYQVEIPSRTTAAEKETGEERKLSESFILLAGMAEGMVSSLLSFSPGLTFTLEDGEFHLIRGDDTAISFSRIRSGFTNAHNGPRFHFTGISSLAKDISFEGSANKEGSVIDGRLELTGIRGHILVDLLPGDMPFNVTEAEVNLGLSLHTEGFRTFEGRFNGSAPAITLVKGRNIQTVRCDTIKGQLTWDKDRLALKVDSLDFAAPRIKLSGNFQQEVKIPELQMDIEGRDVDITSVRETTLFLFDDILTVRKIFGYLRDGHIPAVHFASRGQTATELFNWANFSVEGSLKGLEVLAGEPDHLIKDVSVGVALSDKVLRWSDLTGHLGQSKFSGAGGRLGLFEEYPLDDLTGHFVVRLDQVDPILSSLGVSKEQTGIDLKTMEGEVELSLINLRGPLLRPAEWVFKGEGSVRKFSGELSQLSAPVRLESGRFKFDHQRITFDAVQAGVLDAGLMVRGHVEDYLEDNIKVDLTMGGELGGELIGLISRMAELPPEVIFRTPIRVKDNHLTWSKDMGISFTGGLTFPQGPGLHVDLITADGVMDLKRLAFEDRESQCDLAVKIQDRQVSFAYTGKLKLDSVDRILVTDDLPSGYLAGEITINLPLDHPQDMTAKGRLEGKDLAFVQETLKPLKIETLSLSLDGNRLTFDPAAFSWNEKFSSVTGEITIALDDTPVEQSSLQKWPLREKIDRILSKKANGEGDEATTQDANRSITGEMNIAIEEMIYDRFSLGPIISQVTLRPENIDITVEELHLCNFELPASFMLTPEGISGDIHIAAEGTDLLATMDCLLGMEGTMEGEYSLSASLEIEGEPEDLLSNLDGQVTFVARNGRMQNLPLMTRIFALLNVTEMLRGKLPDLDKEGFAYDMMKMAGNITDGILTIEEAVIDSSIMDIAAEGEMGLARKTLRLTVLVAPLKTVNYIVGKIPIVKHILGEQFVIIPISVTGELKDPKVTPMAASAVGNRLLGILENTITLPATLVEPGDKEDDQ